MRVVPDWREMNSVLRVIIASSFVGFLLAGYVNESNQLSSSEWQSAFKGYHLGFGLPIIGNHFYP